MFSVIWPLLMYLFTVHVNAHHETSVVNHIITINFSKSDMVDANPTLELPALENKLYDIHSGPILVINKQTFFIPSFYCAPPSSRANLNYWVRRNVSNQTGQVIQNLTMVGTHNGDNVYIKLPENLSVYDLDQFGVWDSARRKTIAYVSIPRNISVQNDVGFEEITKDGRKIVRIPKCCHLGEILTTSGCTRNTTAPFETNFPVLDLNDTHINDEPLPESDVQFKPYINDLKCKSKKYPLYPEDNFVFLGSGILVLIDKKTVINQDKFCVETVQDGEHWITAPLICATLENVGPPDSLYYIYATGLLLSSVFFILTAAAFFIVGEEFQIHGLCIAAYSLSMAFAFICLSSAQFWRVEGEACNVFGYIFQLFLVSSFSWLMILCYETYFLIRYHVNYFTFQNRRLLVYFTIGVGIPALILLVSVLSAHVPILPTNVFKPQFGHTVCWFEGHKKRFYFFYIPVFTAIFVSIIHLTFTKLLILRLDKDNQSSSWRMVRDDLKQMFRACVLVVTIVTVCWLTETVSSMVESQEIATPATDILGSLQGLIIFMVFVLHNPVKERVLRSLCKRSSVPERTSAEEHEMFLKRIMRASTH